MQTTKYPHLSPHQQQQLPRLIQLNTLPQMYQDSTHQLWDCDTEQGAMFWCGMKSLFGVDLTRQLGGFQVVYKRIDRLRNEDLIIPKSDRSFDRTAMLEKQLRSLLCACFPSMAVQPKPCAILSGIIKFSFLSPLIIPNYIASGSVNDADNAFIAAKKVAGLRLIQRILTMICWLILQIIL